MTWLGSMTALQKWSNPDDLDKPGTYLSAGMELGKLLTRIHLGVSNQAWEMELRVETEIREPRDLCHHTCPLFAGWEKEILVLTSCPFSLGKFHLLGKL
jgi:hypothetical protein